jgi:aryl-alcohol dehydrogenase-like predicted oxidoreductase
MRVETRRLGATDLSLSRLGLGTWAMGGGGWVGAWGPQDDRASQAAIRRALDGGINWIDTAPIYGFGHAEAIVGAALRGTPRKPIIATKLSRAWDENGKVYGNLQRERVRPAVEGSLRSLQVDAIDLYQIHWPDPDPDIEEAWGAVADLVREGKIRYAGVCNFSLAQLQRLHPIHPVASVQLPYSMLARGIEAGMLEHCARHGIGLLTYSPMERGLLAGRFTRERVRTLPPDDHRRRDSLFQDPSLGATLDLVEGLRPLAARHGRTVAQLAIAWVLRRPQVTAAIVGARAPAQIEETVKAAGWTLSEDEIQAIDALLTKRQEALTPP